MAARRLRCVGEHLRVAHLAAAETTVETTEGLEVVLEAPTVEGALAVAFFGATADAATVAAELRDSLSIHTLGQLKAAVDDWDAVAAAVDAPLPLDASTAAALSRFLPCSTGLRVFALAQQTLRKIADGTATTSYNHGLTPNLSAKALAAGYGAAGMTPEKYEIAPPPGVSWTVNVDCAGFIRNTFQAVTGSSVMDPALRPLSDSSFMRAKDYTRFGQRLPLDVRADSSAAGTVAGASAAVMWRKVSDMRDILHGDIISYGQPGGFVRLNEVGGMTNLLNNVGFELLVSVEGSLGLPMVHILERKDPRVVGRDYEGSGFPQEAVEWAEAAQGWLETEAGIDESIEGLQAMLIDGSDDRQAALSERFTGAEVQLMTYASSPIGGMNPRGHTGHIVFAAGPAGPSARGEGYVKLKTIESTGAAGVRWPENVKGGVMARVREFQQMDDGSWRIPADAPGHAGAHVAVMRMV